jgi:hypothetical protein
VISLTNKTSGEHGRDLYLRKQREVLENKVRLVEIDLLRDGQHTTAVPLNWLAKVTDPPDYHVCIHHFDNLEDYFVYPTQLTDSLPAVGIPLLPGDVQIPLDLQLVFQRTHDAGPYSREIDYQNDTPISTLSDEQTAWASKDLGGRC